MNEREVGAACLKFWASVVPDRAKGRPGDPQARRALRVAETPGEAAMQERTVHLYRMLGQHRYDADLLARVGVVAHVLAHVTEHDGSQTAARRAAARRRPNSNPLVSSLFMDMLVRSTDAEGCWGRFRMFVGKVEGRVNVADLGASVIDWLDPDDRIREARVRRWAFDYASI